MMYVEINKRSVRRCLMNVRNVSSYLKVYGRLSFLFSFTANKGFPRQTLVFPDVAVAET